VETDRGRSALAVVAGASLWGTAGAAQELGAAAAAPWAVAAVRTSLGGILLLATAALIGSWPGVRAVVRHGRGPVAVAAAALAVFQLGYLGGIRLSGVALGTLIAIGSAPVFAGIHGAVTGRRPSRRWLAATVLTLSGTAMLVLPSGEAVGAPPAGVALGLIAGAAYASYAIASKRLLERGLPGFATIAVAFPGAGLLLAPLLLFADTRWMATGTGLVAMAWLTVVAVAISYALFLRGLAGIDAPTATTLTLAEPLMAAFLGIAVVGERFAGLGLVGAIVLATGLAVAGGVPPRIPVGAWDRLGRRRTGGR
jgi:drug/metabolite transporter, DME family